MTAPSTRQTRSVLPLPSPTIDLSNASLAPLNQHIEDVQFLPTKYRQKRSLAGTYDDGVSWTGGTNPLFWMKDLASFHQETSLADCGPQFQAWIQVYMGLHLEQHGQFTITIPFSLWSDPRRDQYLFKIMDWLTGIGIADTIREINARTISIQQIYGYGENAQVPRSLTDRLSTQSCPNRSDDPPKATTHQSSPPPLPDSLPHLELQSGQATLPSPPNAHESTRAKTTAPGPESRIEADTMALERSGDMERYLNHQAIGGTDSIPALEVARNANAMFPDHTPAPPIAFEFDLPPSSYDADDGVPYDDPPDDPHPSDDQTLNSKEPLVNKDKDTAPQPASKESEDGPLVPARAAFWDALARAEKLLGVPSGALHVADGMAKSSNRLEGRSSRDISQFSTTTSDPTNREISVHPSTSIEDIMVLRKLKQFGLMNKAISSERTQILESEEV